MRKMIQRLILGGVAAFAYAGTTNAVQLNPLGSGQVLLYPYYQVYSVPGVIGVIGDRIETLLSINNDANVAQALRVRFVEGHNSRTVFEFNLFLAAGDVWTANLFLVGNTVQGVGTGILTRDPSCISPAFTESIPGVVPSFALFRSDDYQNDGGPGDPERTREGQIEVIAMADLSGSLALAASNGSTTGPANCSLLANLSGLTSEMSRPTGKLRGTASVINVPKALLFGYAAEALTGFTARPLFAADSQPGPGLADVNDAGYPDTVTANVLTDDGLIQASYPQDRAIDAVSATLMSNSLRNEYNTARSLAAQSEWVLAMPTRRYYNDVRYTPTPLPPFAGMSDMARCTALSARVWDRNALSFQLPLASAGNMGPDSLKTLCHDTSVVSLIEVPPDTSVIRSTLLYSANVTNIRPVFQEGGWMDIGFNPGSQFAPPAALRPSVAPHAGKVFHGIPVIGFGVNAIVNGQVAHGVLANYGSLLPHVRSVRCTNGDNPCALLGQE